MISARILNRVFLGLALVTGAVTTTVIGGAAVPAVSAGRVHVTDTLPAFEQTQPVPAALPNVTPDGSVSVTISAAASDGPALVTVSR